MAGLLALKMGKIWSYRKHWSYTSIWWWWRWWWWWRRRWWCWLREEVLNAGRREKVWIFQGTSGDHMDCSRPPENGSRCAQSPARHCLPVPQIHCATWRNTSYELKKYISPIEQMHFSYCTTRKGCNSCVLGGRAFPLCAESPHPAPCQSLRASLTNTLQNFEQILLLNIRQNLSCTHHMTCSLSCFICRLDRACKIAHPWWLRQAKIYDMIFRFWGLVAMIFLIFPYIVY